jgi:uncharacterized protein
MTRGSKLKTYKRGQKKMKYIIKWIAWVIVVIGALNWGLIGLGLGNPIESLGSMAASIVYDLVGLSAVVLIIYKVMKMSKKKK